MNKIARRLSLKDNHPTMIKFNQLADLAEVLGISISFYGQSTIINDRERDDNLPNLFIEDLESNDAVKVFPPTFEFQIVYDSPAYLEQQRLEREEYNKKRSEEEAQAKAKKELEQKQTAEREAKIQEIREREMLSLLKAKYEK